MRGRALGLHATLICMVVLLPGCATVAGGLAGGTLLALGDYVATDGAQDLVAVPMAETEQAARAALAKLNVDILHEKAIRTEGDITRWDFEAAVVGDDIISVDVVIERVTPQMSRIRARARRGPFSPDLTTAAMVVDRIVCATYTAAAQQPASER